MEEWGLGGGFGRDWGWRVMVNVMEICCMYEILKE